MSDWQPIETAPKDPDRFLLLWVEDGYPVLGEWAGFCRKRWIDNAGYSIDPTHWMTLPEPPVVQHTREV